MNAAHLDAGKPRVDLIPSCAILDIGRVFAYGSNKYGDFNWRRGMPWLKLYGSTLRHLYKWAAGEKLDDESALPHLAHAAANILMLMDYAHHHLGEDNRVNSDQGNQAGTGEASPNRLRG